MLFKIKLDFTSLFDKTSLTNYQSLWVEIAPTNFNWLVILTFTILGFNRYRSKKLDFTLMRTEFPCLSEMIFNSIKT